MTPTTSTMPASASSARTWWTSSSPTSIPSIKKFNWPACPSASSASPRRQGSTFGQSQDNFAIVPLSTFRIIWIGRPELLVYIKAPDSRHMVELEDEVRALMRARRHVPYPRTTRSASMLPTP